MNDKNRLLECNDGAYRALDGYSSTISGILSTSLVYASNTEMIRISNEGFYVRGVKLEQDETEAQKLYDALMEFMSGRGLDEVRIRQEVIEECAARCEAVWTDGFSDPGRVCAEAIRKLKERRKEEVK